jgi:hypothetical protein
MLERHLVQAEMHVSDCERHVARQREIVAALVNDGPDLTFAQGLLTRFETLLDMHIAHRNLVWAELAAMRLAFIG